MWLDLDDFKEPETKTHTITFRLSKSEYKALKAINSNVSMVLRQIIKLFFADYKTREKRIESWKQE